MSDLKLNLNGIKDEDARDNFRLIADFINGQGVANNLVAIEIFVTADAQSIKISHGLGSVPLDVLLGRLVAPSAARLVANYSEFTKDVVSFTVSGLAVGEYLSARLLVGSIPNVITSGTVKRGDSETQQMRSKF